MTKHTIEFMMLDKLSKETFELRFLKKFKRKRTRESGRQFIKEHLLKDQVMLESLKV